MQSSDQPKNLFQSMPFFKSGLHKQSGKQHSNLCTLSRGITRAEPHGQLKCKGKGLSLKERSCLWAKAWGSPQREGLLCTSIHLLWGRTHDITAQGGTNGQSCDTRPQSAEVEHYSFALQDFAQICFSYIKTWIVHILCQKEIMLTSVTSQLLKVLLALYSTQAVSGLSPSSFAASSLHCLPPPSLFYFFLFLSHTLHMPAEQREKPREE